MKKQEQSLTTHRSTGVVYEQIPGEQITKLAAQLLLTAMLVNGEYTTVVLVCGEAGRSGLLTWSNLLHFDTELCEWARKLHAGKLPVQKQMDYSHSSKMMVMTVEFLHTGWNKVITVQSKPRQIQLN